MKTRDQPAVARGKHSASGTHIMTVPATRRVGDSQLCAAAVRDFAAVEACLKFWRDVRWKLLRASEERMGDLMGAMSAVVLVDGGYTFVLKERWREEGNVFVESV